MGDEKLAQPRTLVCSFLKGDHDYGCEESGGQSSLA